MAKASDNVFPRFLVSEGGSTATPAAGQVTVYAKADGLLYQKDDAGTETLLAGGAGGGSVATDAIWDAAGDLAVGTGANTAARLAIGAAGGAVSRVNGAVAWNSGTAFPTAATGDRFWRTDVLGGIECVYDGTRWLGPLVEMPLPLNEALPSFTVNTTIGRWHVDGTYGMYLYGLFASVYVGTTNDGSNYWTTTLNRVNSANSATSLGTFDTSADAADTWYYNKAIAVNAVLDSTARLLRVNATVTGSGGAAHVICKLRYRLIIT